MVEFRCVGERSKSIKIHRIVATHFVDGYTDVKNEVDHVDGDKRNNKASNLEWVSRVENVRRGFAKGLMPPMRGSRNGNSNTTEDTVHVVCALLAYYCSNCKKTYMATKLFGVSTSLRLVHDIKYKKSWAFISDEYFTRDSISEIDNIPDDIIIKICEYIIKDDGDLDFIVEDMRHDGINVSEAIVRNIRDGNARLGLVRKAFKKIWIRIVKFNDYRN